MQIPDRPHHPHTTSQIQNGQNYHLRLGLLSADDLPDPHYENPPQVFFIKEKTFTI